MRFCNVTTWNPRLGGRRFARSIRPCGLPATGRLCARHEADRVRLGGAA